MADSVVVKVVGNKLVIEAEMAAKPEPSASGKTLIVASTRGAIRVPFNGGNVSVSLNAYVDNPAKGK